MRWAWFALLLTLAPQPATPEESKFTIEGTVVRLGTTEPLSGIEVTLWSFEAATCRSLNLFADGTPGTSYLLTETPELRRTA